MFEVTLSLIGASFVAGMVTFLAPCTFPLIPAYVGFITGDGSVGIRQSFFNGVGFMFGFSVIFITLGVFVSGAASIVTPGVELWVTRIAGVLVIFWGLQMMHLFSLPIFEKQWTPRISGLKSGTFGSSTLLGAMISVGWTPCIGPVLGMILAIVWNSPQIWDGLLLMTVFSLGLAVPFLVVAVAIGWGFTHFERLYKYTNWISVVSGVFLVFIGGLLMFDYIGQFANNMLLWFDFLNYDAILELL